MKKVKGIGQWKGKDVPGMYQKGGTTKITPEMLDSLKKNHTIETIGNAHLLPDSIKQKFDGIDKMPINPEAIKKILEKFKPEMDAKRKRK
jgi:hypothetical protein